MVSAFLKAAQHGGQKQVPQGAEFIV